MIKLRMTRTERVLDLGYGVTVTVKPLSTAVYKAAIYSAEADAVALATEGGVIDRAGGRIADIPDAFSRAGFSGLRDQFMLQALARHAIADWSGVGDEHGNPAPVEPAYIDALIRDCPLLASRFEVEYLKEMAELSAEGEGYGAALNGSLATAPGSADPAVPNGAESALRE